MWRIIKRTETTFSSGTDPAYIFVIKAFAKLARTQCAGGVKMDSVNELGLKNKTVGLVEKTHKNTKNILTKMVLTFDETRDLRTFIYKLLGTEILILSMIN